MTDQEFYEQYGRMPRRVQPGKKKVKIYWGRIIIALIILILIIVGIVKLIGFAVGKIKGGKENKQANTAASVSAADSIIKDESSSLPPELPPVVTEESSIAEEEPEPEVQDIEFTVCIDAAHGGYDNGVTYLNGIRLEKYDTLNIAARLRDEFEARGVTVYLTRVDDSFMELDERCTCANVNNCDLFISLHRGYSDDSNICGIEAFVSSDKPATDIGFAKNILAKLEETGVSANNGVKCGYVTDPQSDYFTNAYTSMPSVLLNVGYISNENDNFRFDSDIDAYCTAIVDGVIEEAIAQGVIDKDGTRLAEVPLRSEKSYYEILDDEEPYVAASTTTQSEATSETSQITASDNSSQAVQPEQPLQNDTPPAEEPMYTEDGIGTYTDPMMTNG